MNRLKIVLHLEDGSAIDIQTEYASDSIVDMLRKSRVNNVEIRVSAEVRDTRFFDRVWVR